MQRMRNIVGKPIVAGDTGEKIGQVEDLLLDEVDSNFVGVIVKSGGWRQRESVLPVSDIQTFGRDAVIARSASGLIDGRAWRERMAKREPPE